MNLISIFMTLHPDAEEYTFWSAHGTFSRIDHILGYKSSLSQFKKTEILSSIFSDHNPKRLDISYRGKKKRLKKKSTNTRRLNNTFINNQKVTKEMKVEMEKHKQMTMKTQLKTYGMQQQQS